MGANNEINLKKCGEIVIDINTKCDKNKTFIFYCTFCNIKCNQLQKFTLHIEEHLHSAEDILKETVIKFEAEPEEISIQSFSKNQRSQTLLPISSNYQSEEFLIHEIKQEREATNTNDMYYDSDSVSGKDEFDGNNHKLKSKKEEMERDCSDIYNNEWLLSTYCPESRRKYRENSKHNSFSQKLNSTRQVRDLESCRKKCKEKISKEEQKYIFDQYWNCGSYQERQIFVANLIDEEGTQTHTSKIRLRLHTYRYYLKLPNRYVPVCKKCFKYTLCEGEKFIKTAMKKKKTGKLTNMHLT